jgi:ABC-type sugar transport system substrate-binding protein
MKYLKRVISSICILAMIFCMFSGCSDSGSGGGGDSGGSYSQRAKDPMNDEIVISYIPMSTAQENTPIIEAAFKEAFSIYDNITINTYDAQFDPNTQITLINEAITQGVDGIVIQCADASALNNVIREAEEAGIVVITMNIGNTATPTAYVYNSDYAAGWDAAEYLDEYLNGEGNVVILDVEAAIKETCRVATGFEDYCAEKGCFNILENVGMVTSIENGNMTMRDLLTKYDDIDLVYCVNDNQAIGAYQAIKDAGREDDGIIIFGYEGAPAGLAAIKNGEIFGTSYSDPYYESFLIAHMMLYFIQTGITGNELGFEYAPTVELGTTIVTAENIDEIIADTHWDMSAYGY